MMMMMMIFDQEAPITGVVFREILKKKLWSPGSSGNALTTFKSLTGHRRPTGIRLLGLYPYEERQGLRNNC